MTRAIIYLEIEEDEADKIDFINYLQELLDDGSLDVIIEEDGD